MEGKARPRYDTEEFRLVQKYIRTNRRHRKVLEQQVNATGVYRGQHQILMYVADNPEASQKELARLYGVSTATIAVSLKKLEQGGYIERKVDERDNRFNRICITGKGMETVEKSVTIFQEMEQRMFRGFSKEDFQKMGQLLDRIYDNLGPEGQEHDGEGRNKQEGEDL